MYQEEQPQYRKQQIERQQELYQQYQQQEKRQQRQKNIEKDKKNELKLHLKSVESKQQEKQRLNISTFLNLNPNSNDNNNMNSNMKSNMNSNMNNNNNNNNNNNKRQKIDNEERSLQQKPKINIRDILDKNDNNSISKWNQDFDTSCEGEMYENNYNNNNSYNDNNYNNNYNNHNNNDYGYDNNYDNNNNNNDNNNNYDSYSIWIEKQQEKARAKATEKEKEHEWIDTSQLWGIKDNKANLNREVKSTGYTGYTGHGWNTQMQALKEKKLATRLLHQNTVGSLQDGNNVNINSINNNNSYNNNNDDHISSNDVSDVYDPSGLDQGYNLKYLSNVSGREGESSSVTVKPKSGAFDVNQFIAKNRAVNNGMHNNNNNNNNKNDSNNSNSNNKNEKLNDKEKKLKDEKTKNEKLLFNLRAAAEFRGDSNKSVLAISESLEGVSIDSLLIQVLKFDLNKLSISNNNYDDHNNRNKNNNNNNNNDNGNKISKEVEKEVELCQVPFRFLHEDQYIESFHPLLIEEVKAALDGHVQGTNDRNDRNYNNNNNNNNRNSSSRNNNNNNNNNNINNNFGKNLSIHCLKALSVSTRQQRGTVENIFNSSADALLNGKEKKEKKEIKEKKNKEKKEKTDLNSTSVTSSSTNSSSSFSFSSFSLLEMRVVKASLREVESVLNPIKNEDNDEYGTKNDETNTQLIDGHSKSSSSSIATFSSNSSSSSTSSSLNSTYISKTYLDLQKDDLVLILKKKTIIPKGYLFYFYSFILTFRISILVTLAFTVRIFSKYIFLFHIDYRNT